MKILIPMAGEGSRFAKEGYTFPKQEIGLAAGICSDFINNLEQLKYEK